MTLIKGTRHNSEHLENNDDSVMLTPNICKAASLKPESVFVSCLWMSCGRACVLPVLLCCHDGYG